MTEQKSIQKVSQYMRSDLVRERFAEVVGANNVGAYISSVLLAVANSKELQECTTESVYISALRAATLRLSVDPSTGQAYLVPFGGKATLIVGYKGLMDMAVRTGKYRYINVTHIYQGEVVEEERLSGFHSLAGKRTGDKVIGWLAAFQMMNGYAKTLYMTVDEVHDHAKKYSKSYNFKASGWQTDPAAMERKTVLRLLLRRWGYLDPADMQTLEQIEAEPEAIDGEFNVEPVMEADAQEAKLTQEQLMAELGYTDPAKTPEG